MAARLGGEFTALLTLADIDHAILSRLDLDRVIETVVMRMREVVPADYVSVAIVDRNAPAMVRDLYGDQRRRAASSWSGARSRAKIPAFCSPIPTDSGSIVLRR